MNWLRRIFTPASTSWPRANKVALLFGINDYSGGDNDLNGCLNDLELAQSRLDGFQIRKFKDSEVTKKRFKNELQYALDNAETGDIIYVHYSGHGTYVPDKNGDEIDGYDEALYLYDGELIDDETGEILQTVKDGVSVVLLLDSCFSGTATRIKGKVRFMPPSEPKEAHKRIKRIFHEDMKWIVISGCGENQTSADAYINGKYQGAFTYFAMSTLLTSYTYRQWHSKIREFLPSRTFEQAPTLEGPDEMLDRKVFT